jgi:hypothetical protein
LRSCATPNGKNHPDIRYHKADIRSQMSPPPVRQTLLFRRHFMRDRHSPPVTPDRPPGDPARSCNSLLHHVPSTLAIRAAMRQTGRPVSHDLLAASPILVPDPGP